MKLISTFKDYYDSLSKNPTLSDQSFSFVRNTEKLKVDADLRKYCFTCGMLSGYGYGRAGSDSLTLIGNVVGFCGTLYPYVKMVKRIGSVETIEHCYTLEQVEYYVGDHNLKLLERYESGVVKTLTSYFNGVHLRRWSGSSALVDLEQYFLKNCLAIFTINDEHVSNTNTLVVNPKLEDVQFYRVFDPYTATITLEMYLTNQLVQRDEIKFQPTDELKVQSHGFDKWSFRKMPE